MKKKHFSLLFMLLSSYAFSQNANNVFKLGLNVQGYPGFFYERALGKFVSVSLGGHYVGEKKDGFIINGFQPSLQVRYYFSDYYTLTKESPQGPFIAPLAIYQEYSLKNQVCSCEAVYRIGSAGGIVGWQQMFFRFLAVEVFAGYTTNVWDQLETRSTDPFSAGTPLTANSIPPGYVPNSSTGLYFNQLTGLYLDPKSGYTATKPEDFTFQVDNFQAPQTRFNDQHLRLGFSVGIWF